MFLAEPFRRAGGNGISIDFFHDSWSPTDWRKSAITGMLQPRNVDAKLATYSDGQWLYTDAGWTGTPTTYSWRSITTAAGASDQIGWVWVPGTEWGPAWVSWAGVPARRWAPLPRMPS